MDIKMRLYNNLRVQNFAAATQQIHEQKEAIESISLNGLKYIIQINQLGFFTVESSEGLCDEDYHRRANVSGFIPKNLTQQFKKALKERGALLYKHTISKLRTHMVVVDYEKSETGELRPYSIFADIEKPSEEDGFQYSRKSLYKHESYGKPVPEMYEVSKAHYDLVLVTDNSWCAHDYKLFQTIIEALLAIGQVPVTELPSKQQKDYIDDPISTLQSRIFRKYDEQITMDTAKYIIQMAQTIANKYRPGDIFKYNGYSLTVDDHRLSQDDWTHETTVFYYLTKDLLEGDPDAVVYADMIITYALNNLWLEEQKFSLKNLKSII